MARIRYLKPDFFLDEEVATLSPLARLVFQGLWCYADREGRLEDKPLRLKHQILPYDQVEFNALLQELTRKPFIVRYDVDGKSYIQIINFKKHQILHRNEKPSVFPVFSGANRKLPEGIGIGIGIGIETGIGIGTGIGMGTGEGKNQNPPPTFPPRGDVERSALKTEKRKAFLKEQAKTLGVKT